MKILRIAGATVNQTPIDWENNLGNIRSAIAKAEREGAELICFPELTITGYGCEDLFLSEWLAETAKQKLLSLAPLSGHLTICIGLPIRVEGVTYNGMAVLQHGKISGISLKQNLPGDGIHYEPRWFSPWKSGEVIQLHWDGLDIPAGDLIYHCGNISFAFEICEDAWRSKRPAEEFCKRGVDLILNPSASHFAFGKNLIREKIVVESSEKFQCAFMMVNQLGNEAGKVIYDGDILLALKGKLLLRNPRLSFHSFVVQVADINFNDDMEANPEPDSFETKNDEFTQAASLALFDYLRKSKALGYTLSLSGGADSSCCAVLVSEAVNRASDELGWKSFTEKLPLIFGGDSVLPSNLKEAVGKVLLCAYQSTVNSSPETSASASNLAQSLGSRYFSWSIDDQVDANIRTIQEALGRDLNWSQDDIALQNIQARSRSPIIWLMTNATKTILLTTSNRSEGDVGYATMDGDTSGSLAPLAGIDKPFILQWLKWAEKSLGYQGLESVNQLTPTAELRPLDSAQSDEKDLMPYTVLVDIEREAILKRQSPVQVYEALRPNHTNHTLLKSYIIRFFRLWSANQWKRERLAPSFHFDELNVDPRSWCRFPIVSGSFSEEIKLLEAHQ
ncbi:MAG: NAD(+) synthase [Bacteroidetes bacterium]|nr:NAD(+) synthase [Bacteroidota bacterium]